MVDRFVFHICHHDEWEGFKKNKVYKGSSQDIDDGFIHLSSKEQIVGSARKHRKGQEKLVLLTMDAEYFGENLRWETSRHGEKFPHHYGVIYLEAVVRVDALELDQDSIHIFPDSFV